jgi:hypothetical protein
MPPSMVGLDQLAAHPGNVGEDLGLTPRFLASVTDIGVRIPLRGGAKLGRAGRLPAWRLGFLALSIGS